MCTRFVPVCLALLIASLWPYGADSREPEFPLDVYPAEHRTMIDPHSGAELLFLTTAGAKDTNFYFHERSWMADSSVVFFYSDREAGGLMGYIVATGELFRVATPLGAVGSATAAINRNSVFALRGTDVVEIALTIQPADGKPSTVTARERIVGRVPAGRGNTALNESCDARYLALGINEPAEGGAPMITLIDEQSGETKVVCRVSGERHFAYHVQWSHTNPNLLSFAALHPRLNVVDIRDGSITHPYVELPGELVTHEHWWVNDQIVFCGGLHPKPTEDSHVKVVNVHTGLVRIIGAGSWWPDGMPKEIAKRNYWHCAGSDDGRWVVADNWHGDITVFEAKTTRPHVLTSGHRTYGTGEHPHVGWDRKSRQVVFTSHLLGDPNVCIATIPQDWQAANP